MATGQFEGIGTQIGSSGSNGGSGNTIAKAIDADFLSFYDAANLSDDWTGIDLGVGNSGTLTGFRVAARLGDSSASTIYQFEDRLRGGVVEVSDDPTFATGVTTVLTLPNAPPTIPARHFTDFIVTGAPAKRCARYLGPKNARCNVGEVRFLFSSTSVTAAKPAQPTVSPWGGNFPTRDPLVTITQPTTSAQAFYTLDGTAPDNTKTPYSGPFNVHGAVTLKAVSYDGSLATTTSDVCTCIFKNYGFKANEPLYDDRGNLVEAHSGGLLKGPKGEPLKINGWYYWCGGSANRYNVVQGFSDGLGADGIWLFKSASLLEPKWIFVGNILDNAASSYTVRPHMLYCPTNNNFVIWAKTYGSFNACIATAPTPEGPWTWVNVAYQPNGANYLDANLYQDDDLKAYAIWSDSAKINIQLLADNYQTVTGSPTTIVTGSQEAPAMAKDHTGTYVCVVSQSNYYNSAAGFGLTSYRATTPLGTWTISNTDLFEVDPTGTNYNVQSTDLLAFPNGLMLLGDYWVHSDIYQSGYAFIPIDGYAQIPSTWDLRRFDIPDNNLKKGCVSYYPLNELTSTSDPKDLVGGLDLTRAGVMPSNGARLRWRTFTNYADRTNNATHQTGDIQVWWNVWVRRGGGTNPVIFSKDDTGNEREYALYFLNSTGNIFFEVSANGTTTTSTSTSGGGMLPSNVWVMVTVWHDSVLNEIGMAINGAFNNSVSYASGIRAGTAPLTVGNTAAHGNAYTGDLRDFGMWKAPKPTQKQLDALFNNAIGLPYELFNNEYSLRGGNAGHRPYPYAPGRAA